tara:strand:- start:806 stop:1222 length:417 start_codon:yes stop_codon:yes gene_type:complete
VKYNNERSRDFTNPHLPTGSNEAGGAPTLPTPGKHLFSSGRILSWLCLFVSNLKIFYLGAIGGGHMGFLNTPQYGYPMQAGSSSAAYGKLPGAPQAASPMQLSPAGGMGGMGMNGGPGSVVIASGFDENMVTPDIVFT